MLPKTSVLLSVRNGGQTLDRALQSLLDQTEDDFEIICVDDASTDQTSNILQQWSRVFGPERWRLLVNQHHHGLTFSLNRALRRARGQYIARLDADDQWHPTKLAKQVNWIEQHSSVGVLGTGYINVTRQGKSKIIRCPQNHHTIRHTIWFKNPFGHSCVLMRSGLLRAVGGWDPHWPYAQDRDLWFRLFPLTQFHNLPEILVKRSIEVAPSKQSEQKRMTVAILKRYLRAYRPALPAWLGLVEPWAVQHSPHWLKNLRRLTS